MDVVDQSILEEAAQASPWLDMPARVPVAEEEDFDFEYAPDFDNFSSKCEDLC